MGWLFLVILFLFVAISVKWLSRVLLVFAGTPLLRICGVMLFVASVFVALTAVFGGITLALGFDKFPADCERNAVPQLLDSRAVPRRAGRRKCDRRRGCRAAQGGHGLVNRDAGRRDSFGLARRRTRNSALKGVCFPVLVA